MSGPDDPAAAFDAAKERGDAPAMAKAALELAAGHVFGAHPGRVPAYLHEAYQRAGGDDRARLAAALARTWAYGYQPWHGEPFAVEAVALAERAGDPALLAETLDALLLVRWGPDQFADRVAATARLEDVVKHVRDPEARLRGYLWRMTTALESLDAVALARQVRALEQLAEETGLARVRFFAAARLGMHALLRADPAEALRQAGLAREAGDVAGEADVQAIVHTLTANAARQTGDLDVLREEAAGYEAFGAGEAIASVSAEAATLWLAAGEPERAAVLLDQLAGHGLDGIARDVDWLLTVCSLTEVAGATGALGHAEAGVDLLTPYAGRGVVNAGAVAFVGVVDDYLRQACAALGRHDEARAWAASAAVGYRRVGAQWWLRRLAVPAARPGCVHLHPSGDGVWTVGPEGSTVLLRDMRGLHHLRVLLGRPGADVDAAELSASGHAGERVEQAPLGEVIDRRAVAAYRARIAELEAEQEEAREWNDPERAERAGAERDALVQHLRAASGLGGRLRTTGATSERARVAVRKAIAAAVERITAADAGTGRLLRDTVRTGSTCRYEPDPARAVTWVLD